MHLVPRGDEDDDDFDENSPGNLGVYWPTGRLLAFGQAGDDLIHVNGSVAHNAWLYGDAGDDDLNSGRGNDALFGGLGDDRLLGQRARDLLIGGQGRDRLIGGGDDDDDDDRPIGGGDGDVLIGGTTSIDADEAALQAALAAWSGPDDYDQRVAAMDSLLDAFDDFELDRLTGAAGRDLFFGGFDDHLTDVKRRGALAETVL